jgi:hypothetical protein
VDDPDPDFDDHEYKQVAAVVAALSAAFAIASVIVPAARLAVAIALVLVLIALIAVWTRLRQVAFMREARPPRYPTALISTVTVFAVIMWAFVLMSPIFKCPAALDASRPTPPAASRSPVATATADPSPTPTPSATPTATPIVSPLPYHADWSTDLAGWSVTSSWRLVDGVLTNDGRASGEQMTATAPLDLSSVRDYVVEADIELVRYGDEGAFSGADSFGFVVRAGDPKSGYHAGHCVQAGLFACDPGGPMFSAAIWDAGRDSVLKNADFQPPEQSWHHYRMEVKGATITFTVPDLGVNLSTTDNTYLNGGQVGLFSNSCQISVKNFVVQAAA